MSEEAEKPKQKRRYATRLFPKNTLLDAFRIAQSIHENAADQPYDRLDLAKSLEYSPESSLFRTLITSSGRFGLTTGGPKAARISLTDLGKSTVAPKDEREKAEGLKQALFNIDFYRRFFSRFDGHRLPNREYLKNTLNRDFGIPVPDCDECYDMIIRNAKELGVITAIKDAQYIKMSELVPPAPTEGEERREEGREEEEEKFEEEEKGRPPERIEAVVPRVFISHSKNKKIVGQIKQILDFGQFDYRIAEESETTAIPIPDKVFGSMRECNCAIINVSADEPERREDGTYGINQNVLIEIGAAFLLYNKKVILLVDKRIDLPSNLQGLYRCEYEGDELSFSTALKLQKTLSEFRKL